MSRFSSNIGMSICAFALFAVGFVQAYGSIYQMRETLSAQSRHILPEWCFHGNLNHNFAIVLIVGMYSSFACGAGLWLFITNVRFLWNLREFEVVPLPNVLRATFRKTTNFCLIGTATWFVGVGIIRVFIVTESRLVCGALFDHYKCGGISSSWVRSSCSTDCLSEHKRIWLTWQLGCSHSGHLMSIQTKRLNCRDSTTCRGLVHVGFGRQRYHHIVAVKRDSSSRIPSR